MSETTSSNGTGLALTIFDEPALASHPAASTLRKQATEHRESVERWLGWVAEDLADALVYHRRNYPRRKVDVALLRHDLDRFEERKAEVKAARQVEDRASGVQRESLRRNHPDLFDRIYGAKAVAA